VAEDASIPNGAGALASPSPDLASISGLSPPPTGAEPELEILKPENCMQVLVYSKLSIQPAYSRARHLGLGQLRRRGRVA
jgi:hypothetical protein